MNRAQAFKYALRKNGHHPKAIIELPHEIELNISANQESAGTSRVAWPPGGKIEQRHRMRLDVFGTRKGGKASGAPLTSARVTWAQALSTPRKPLLVIRTFACRIKKVV